ncbi:MAG TPA: hypothetical protein VFL94_01880 [Actinomycetales bacterium]|nr:hypothetical protein [Actinomycetales bacterium]
MKRRTSLAAIVGVLAILLGVAVAPPALATVPPASVQVLAPGQIGQHESAIVPLQVRCRVGLESRNLVVTVTQDVPDGTATGSATVRDPLRCNGTWHTLSVELGIDATATADFEPGQAKVTARLTVRNPATGGTPAAGTDTRFIKLLAPAEAELGTAPIRHGSGGVARVPVRIRCQIPWLPVELIVEVAQNDGFLHGQTIISSGDTRLVCDGEWHRVLVYVGPDTAGDKFFTGPAQVTVFFDIEDPVNFEPEQASLSILTEIVDDD